LAFFSSFQRFLVRLNLDLWHMITSITSNSLFVPDSAQLGLCGGGLDGADGVFHGSDSANVEFAFGEVSCFALGVEVGD
jgi:hypothetical protein